MSRGEGATHHRAVIHLALITLLVAALGAAAAARGPEPSAHPGPPRSDAVPCQAGQLAARLATRPPTPGREHVLLVLANRGSSSCGMFGFVGLEMLAPDGSALATDLQRAGAGRPAMEVVVPPAGEAAALLSWTTFSTDEACVAPAGVEVTPPNDTAGLVLAWPTTSLVCRFGQIDLEPVHPVAAARSRASTAGLEAEARPMSSALDRGPA
jgi:Protein of unknown function (DUF4232)